jgi:ATP-dependent Lon protease
MLKHSDLFDALPKGYYDTAFLDRIHCYIPGWEVQKLNYEMFTNGYGFIVDYLAEALRELRKEDYSAFIKKYYKLNETLTSRDRDGITKTFSGLAKIIYPDGKCIKEEVRELLEFSIESRKRVKNQLIKIDDTFELVNFDYTDEATGQVYSVETLENIENNFSFKPNRPGEQQDSQTKTADEKDKSTVGEPELMAGQVLIRENQTGISYEKLFGKYLKGAKEITLKDPYIRLPYQMKLLLEFCHLLSTLKNEEEEILLTVVTWNDPDHLEESRHALTEITDSVFDIGINLKLIVEEGHDRTIESDTGWKIILGRGLDIFQRVEGRFSIAELAQERRLCKGCEVTYIKN